ncbi:putative bifunctional diguanylate cyclase/phosphodiesterase [Saccharospirillum mangrovi]|uniref:putative bifunctional diguanylate cyclase/phosphodiesterase n=1 Tax=Saccharospirillum mangrovi TaxID=2161747 RepID=UPI000D390140|nr:EAL domain-containing protein [Saccharospirillum mangrovi]
MTVDFKKSIRTLVVEDDSQDFLLIKTALRNSDRADYQVRHLTTLAQATDALVDGDFDILLLDYFLGEHSGLDVLNQAREIHCTKPIVVMTGTNAPELDDMLMKQGAADFIPKDDLSTAFLDRTIRHALERKSAELEIAELVRRDHLTGLGNRVLFEEHMELAIARASRSSSQLAVLFMDLDRFKDVNDSLGHHIGDLLLTLVGDRLKRSVRKSDFVARIGGDEFTVLLDGINSPEDVSQIVEHICKEVCRPAPVSNTTLDVSVSIGVALYPENGELPIELMQKADMALYESKALGPGHYHFFTEHLQARLMRGLELEKALRDALADNEFELFFQPQIDIDSQQIAGLEALIRWRRSDGELVSPDEFIPVAVRCGLIVPIGQWVIETACSIISRWRKAGIRVPMSINVSPRQLKFNGFVDHLLDCVRHHELAPGDLEIELTEEVFIDSGVSYRQMMQKIKDAGVRIAIDDFGTGYSSMRYLRDLPLDRIKIDRSFVSGNGEASLSEPAITQSILSLAHGLHLEVVAEGVETNEQVNLLCQQGCRYFQGYHFYRPMPLAELEPRLSNH